MTEYKPEDYIKYRIERAQETIDEVQTHIENKFGIQPSIECIMHVSML
jgi:hypothetical protein